MTVTRDSTITDISIMDNDYWAAIEILADEIMTWESQTGRFLDSCDPLGNFKLPSLYNDMAVKAWP
jgi:hypothetical protein